MLEVAIAEITGTTTEFSFIVPGDQRWVIRTVFAVALTAVGGAPNRAYLLSVTDGTTLVAQAGAGDAGAEPATCSVTWANSAAGQVSAGNVGTSVAPFANFLVNPGYEIVGTIVNPAAGDTWSVAACWYDFTYTA